jgi:hypothetical protein
MNKIGDGKNPAKEPAHKEHQKALETSCFHFLTALRQHTKATPDERKRLGSVMDQHLKLILSAASELKRAGLGKESVEVEKSYKAYMKDGASQHLAALEHTLATLREFNR